MITIITPCYNVKPYIEQCVNSVLSQKFSDFEWILVDDGSTDGTADIIRQYSESDSRIHLYSQNNQGPAAARNLALEHVKGGYITFLDSDDWIVPDALSYIDRVIKEYHPDMVMWNFQRYIENSFKLGTYPMPEAGYHDFKSTQDYAADFIFQYKNRKGQYFPSCWIRAIKAEIINNNAIRFNPSLKRTEDYMFLSQVQAYLNNMFVINVPLTVYRANGNSITHNYTDGYMDMIKIIYDEILKLPLNIDHDELARRADLMYIYRAFVAVEQELNCNKSHSFKAIKEIVNSDNLQNSIHNTESVGKAVFGKRYTILKMKSPELLYLYYKIKK